MVIKESAKKFNQELTKAITSALVAAFGLLTALAWKDVVTAYMTKFVGNTQGTLIGALIITIISVIAIMIITKIASKPEEGK